MGLLDWLIGTKEERVLRGLKSSKEAARIRTVQRLVQQGPAINAEIGQRLAAMAGSDESGDARAEAIAALAGALLKDDDQTREAIRSVKDPTACEAILGGLGDSDDSAQHAAVEGLLQLIDAADPVTDTPVRELALRAESVDLLLKALLHCLNRLVPKQAEELLLEKLGWEPQSDEEKAFLAVYRDDWDAIEGLGTAACVPLGLAISRDGLANCARRLSLGGATGDPSMAPAVLAVIDELHPLAAQLHDVLGTRTTNTLSLHEVVDMVPIGQEARSRPLGLAFMFCRAVLGPDFEHVSIVKFPSIEGAQLGLSAISYVLSGADDRLCMTLHINHDKTKIAPEGVNAQLEDLAAALGAARQAFQNMAEKSGEALSATIPEADLASRRELLDLAITQVRACMGTSG